MGHFGFFQLIQNYAETTLLIDKKIISQEASHAVQQSFRRVKTAKKKHTLKKIVGIFYSRFFKHKHSSQML